jgi:hypothetical protein
MKEEVLFLTRLRQAILRWFTNMQLMLQVLQMANFANAGSTNVPERHILTNQPFILLSRVIDRPLSLQ